MSMNLKGRNIEFIVKVGARSNVVINIADASGVAKNLSDTATYATAKWKIWKPDGTLLVNGTASYSNRSTGEITYLLASADTVIANAGIWEGEVELLNSSGIMTEQSETFNFTIEESY
tara:strand:- start:3076 stop:3429 length:354 start_codon:yes stop_codon:yes gene_type:complete